MSANEVVIFTGDSKRVNKADFYHEHTEALCLNRVSHRGLGLLEDIFDSRPSRLQATRLRLSIIRIK